MSGLLVTRADLVAALRIYIPDLVDLRPLDDGHFVLSLVPVPGSPPAGSHHG